MKFGGICISMCQCGSSIRSDRQMEQCRKWIGRKKWWTSDCMQKAAAAEIGDKTGQDRTHSEAEEEEDKGKVNDCL